MTDRSATDEFNFTGKIILAVDAFPDGPHADAVKNRSLDVKIEPSLDETSEFLQAAASDSSRFPDQRIASLVLKGLLQNLSEDTFETISYRRGLPLRVAWRLLRKRCLRKSTASLVKGRHLAYARGKPDL